MAPDLMNLSPAKLKDLRKSPKITLRYASSQEELDAGASRIIHESFPLAIATTFSTKWAALFPPISKNSAANLHTFDRKPITIVGSSRQTVSQIVAWMLACCDGRGVQPYPSAAVDHKPFSTYFIVRETADLMGISFLSKEMVHRMKHIAKGQIHSEDVRAMYLHLPKGHPVLKDIANHVANLMLKRELRAFGAYRTLREEIGAFDTDIQECIQNIIATRDKKREEEIVAQKALRTGSGKGKKIQRAQDIKQKAVGGVNRIPATRFKAFNAQRPHRMPDNVDTVTADNKSSPPRRPVDKFPVPTEHSRQSIVGEPQLQHKTIRCMVKRKARCGRPSYVSLSLADAGVTKDEFTGEPFMPYKLKGKFTKNTDNEKIDQDQSFASRKTEVEIGSAEAGNERGSIQKEAAEPDNHEIQQEHQSQEVYESVIENVEKLDIGAKDQTCTSAKSADETPRSSTPSSDILISPNLASTVSSIPSSASSVTCTEPLNRSSCA